MDLVLGLNLNWAFLYFRLESEKVKIIMSNTRDAREQRARSRMLERE